jgi:SAM-dependent methyltransferase
VDRSATGGTAAATGWNVYSRPVLEVYDFWVHGVSNRFAWKVQTGRLQELYNRHASANHAEFGVGTGRFLARCRWPSERPRIVLCDRNPNCLAVASKRLRRYQPEAVRCDLLSPIAGIGEPFDSIGLTYVLHCLPGEMPAKAAVLARLSRLLRPGGVLFGATLLGDPPPATRLGRRLSTIYNRRGIFSNDRDDVDSLRAALTGCFGSAELSVEGSAVLFVARAD